MSHTAKKYNIDPDKPLPSGLDTEYWETFAKLILEKIYPEKFFNLSVDGEKPDLRNIDSEIGVEVTSVDSKESREIDNLYSRQYSYGNNAQRAKALKRITELGGKAEEFFLVHPVISRDITKFYSAVKTKTKRLNTDYSIFNENDLFIFCTYLILDKELPEILKKITENSIGDNLFHFVYIYRFGGDLYEFDIINQIYKHLKVDERIVQQLAVDTRQILTEKYHKNN